MLTLAALNDLLTKFIGFYRSSLSGLHEAAAQMRESELELDEDFRILARYVDRMAMGREAVILSAGFNRSNQPKPATRSPFSASNGINPNEVVLKCKAVTGARAYTWQNAVGTVPEKEGEWIFAGTSSQATFTISNLTSLTKHWFRYCAVTPAGMQAWSELIMKIVL